jgi:putative ABC transport system permease protein
MSFFGLLVRFVRQRWVTFVLTALSIAAGTTLVTGILLLREQSEEAFSQKETGYEILIGAKGSPLQLVLNTMYHTGAPVGNISLEVLRRVEKDRRVGSFLPMVFGDNVQGHKVIGTTTRLFDGFEYRKGRSVQLQSGRAFAADYEAVIGSEMAVRTGLREGSTVLMTHGMQEEGEQHDFRPIVITGILAPTATAIDRGMYTTMRTVWDAHYEEYLEQRADADALLEEADETHEHHDHEEHTTARDTIIPEDFTTITAIAVKLKSPVFFESFIRSINEGTTAQAVLPVREIADLFAVVGNINGLLLAVSWLVVVIGATSVFIAMYTSLKERRREIAILRALGAHRRTVFALMITEAMAAGLAGGVTGILLAHVGLLLMAPSVQAQTGVPVSVSGLYPFEGVVLLAVLLMSIGVALLPALKAYRVDVSRHLTPAQ